MYIKLSQQRSISMFKTKGFHLFYTEQMQGSGESQELHRGVIAAAVGAAAACGMSPWSQKCDGPSKQTAI